MNKDNLIELILKEIKEMETLTKSFSDFEKIPDVMFQLSDSKVNNIKDLFNILEKDNKAVSDVVEKTLKEEKSEAPLIEKTEIEPVQIEENLSEIKVQIDKDSAVEKTTEVLVTEHKIVVEEKPLAKEDTKLTEKAQESHKKATTIAETIIEKKSSVNEKLSVKASVPFEKVLSNKKIEDFKKAINLNDKFRFQRELFKGNASLMNQTLDVLNETTDKNEALDFLSSFEWNTEDQTVIEFMELVNRKFIE